MAEWDIVLEPASNRRITDGAVNEKVKDKPKTARTRTKSKTTVSENDSDIKVVGSPVLVETSVSEFDRTQRQKIGMLVANYYDQQKLRISIGNRIVDSLRTDLDPNKKKKKSKNESSAESKDREASEHLKLIKIIGNEYIRVTEHYIDALKSKRNIEDSIAHFGKELAFIKNGLDYALVKNYFMFVEAEQDTLEILKKEVVRHPMWDAFFRDVTGCGHLMAAVCIAYIDIDKCRTYSSLWKYSGLDVVDGEGRSRKHRSPVKYINTDGEEKETLGLGYNPKLKTKMCGVLASRFIMVRGGADKGYGKIYYDYKNRLDSRPDTANFSPKHKDVMAKRYAVKMFLKDMWKVWRTMRGYSLRRDYDDEYLGRDPHSYNEAFDHLSGLGQSDLADMADIGIDDMTFAN